jgi:hypothetical protein
MNNDESLGTLRVAFFAATIIILVMFAAVWLGNHWHPGLFS